MEFSSLSSLIQLGGGYALAAVVLILYSKEVNGKHRTLKDLVEKNTNAWVDHTRCEQRLVDVIENLEKTVSRKDAV